MTDDVIEKFKEYHKNNPHVFEEIMTYVREAKSKGFKNYTIAGIFEIIRWHSPIETDRIDGFKISNDFKPLYARLVEHKYPEFKGFFKMKNLKKPY